MSEVTLYCSFCGKSQHEVTRLIAGPAAFICDECVDLCGVMVAEFREEAPAADEASAFLAGAHPGFAEAVRAIVREEIAASKAPPAGVSAAAYYGIGDD